MYENVLMEKEPEPAENLKKNKNKKPTTHNNQFPDTIFFFRCPRTKAL